MLEERRSLVTRPDQIKFTYDVILDSIMCGHTAIPITDLLPKLQAKSRKDPATGINDYTREHRVLESLLPR